MKSKDNDKGVFLIRLNKQINEQIADLMNVAVCMFAINLLIMLPFIISLIMWVFGEYISAIAVKSLPYSVSSFTLLLLIIFLVIFYINKRNQIWLGNEIYYNLKLVIYLGKITLCFVIIGLCGFFYSLTDVSLFSFLDSNLPGIMFSVEFWLSFLVTMITFVCGTASIYFLFSSKYRRYISEKILRLYEKTDGEYIIISDSKLLFWLPLFWTDAVYIVGIGIKAKKNGNCLEVSGIRGELRFKYDNYFYFKFNDKPDFSCGNNFGQINFGQINDRTNITFAYNQNRWLFVLDNCCGEYDNSKRHSYNRLMGIYFNGKGIFSRNFGDDYQVEEIIKIEEIIYNIITQTSENKVIRKSIDGDFITEYYWEAESKYSKISKITNTKEGRYNYCINISFDIKEFMKFKNIHPRGLFEYRKGWYSDIVYCLNGNYFKYIFNYHLEQITLEEYLEILEADCKYQRDEEKRRKIIYNIITQIGENEVIYKNESIEYYYKEKHPIYNEYCSISKHITSGKEFFKMKYCNFCIKDFMQLNDVHPKDVLTTDEDQRHIFYCLNGNYFLCYQYNADDQSIYPITKEEFERKKWNQRHIFYCLNGNYFHFVQSADVQEIYLYRITKEEFEQEKKKYLGGEWVEFKIFKKPKDAVAYYKRGYAYYEKGKIDKAISDFNEAMRLDPSLARTYCYIGDGYFDDGDYYKAISYYTKAIRLNPNYAEAYHNRGIAYDRKRDPDKAISDSTEAIRLDPNLAEAYHNRGIAYDRKGDTDKAIADFNEAARLDPNLAKTYYDKGDGYFDDGDYYEAISYYTEAIRLNPNYAYAYNNRGIAYNRKRDPDKAIADFNEAIRLDPNYAYAYNNRGVAYDRKGDMDKAIADFNEAIRLDPNYALAYNNRGITYDRKGDMDKAIADFSEVIQMNPNHAGAYLDRGNAYDNKGDTDKAIADYTEAIRLVPDFANAYNYRGKAYDKKGDKDKAVADFNEAKRLNQK
ncbi:tetratricopeptide repeat protein [Fibrobacteria bacterium R8-3-H12]